MVAGLHRIFEVEEIEHLLEDKLPLGCVLLRVQDHVEVERQVLVHLGKTFLYSQMFIIILKGDSRFVLDV